MKFPIKITAWVIVFAVAMAFMENAVVVYLRQLYYPEGFAFPLKAITMLTARVEFFRELATVIMLVAVGILAGKTRLQRFAFFVLAFAVWDIFYYVFLYLCLGWPQSLNDWDILFLVPVPWIGPVWAPCLLSCLMIAGALFIIRQTGLEPRHSISRLNWTIMIAGALTCIIAFMWDYLEFTDGNFWTILSGSDLFREVLHYVPSRFNHALFFSGFALMCLALALHAKKQLYNQNKINLQ